MREARVDTMKFPIQKWRCVTERLLPSPSEQRLLDTGQRIEILTNPGVTYKTEEIPIFLGERATRMAMHEFGIQELDPVVELEKDARIVELEAQNERLETIIDGIDAIESADFRARRKAGRPKTKEAA